MTTPTRRLDPRVRVVYLLGVGLGVFLLPRGWPLVVAASSQAVLWLVVGLPPRRLVRQITKLWLFSLFVVGSYAFFADDPRTDVWRSIAVGFGRSISVNVGGLEQGLAMIARLVTVIMASQVARAGDPRAVAAGLGSLRVPPIVALSLDVVLALLASEDAGGGGRGGRGGRGGGGGGRGGHEPSDGTGARSGERRAGRLAFLSSIRGLAAGDVAPLVARLERQIDRAEAHVGAREQTDDADAEGARLRRDVAVIAGVSATMLALKAVKLLPSVPFAPGYKLVVLTPLYVAAALLTHRRTGATLTGLTMGTVAFLLGDGRYGLFEILKHVTPGVVCDLTLPWMVRGGREPGRLGWSVLGAAIGASRVATVFLVTLALQPPALAYAGLVPNMLFQATFGAFSGYISAHISRAIRRARDPLGDDVERDRTRMTQTETQT